MILPLDVLAHLSPSDREGQTPDTGPSDPDGLAVRLGKARGNFAARVYEASLRAGSVEHGLCVVVLLDVPRQRAYLGDITGPLPAWDGILALPSARTEADAAPVPEAAYALVAALLREAGRLSDDDRDLGPDPLARIEEALFALVLDEAGCSASSPREGAL